VGNLQNLVVDIGNTAVKTAVFVGDELVERKTWTSFEQVLQHYGEGAYAWLVSSVGRFDRPPVLPSPFYELTAHTPLPIKLHYHTPHTLGVDRIAAAVGAWHRFAGQNVLVIDAGSCITYDLVSANGVFEGGIISPGLRMRFRAMAQFTSSLPDLSVDWARSLAPLPGKSTQACMAIGGFEGMCMEMEGFIRRFRKDYAPLTVVLTGGDAPFFESKLKEPIFADSNLVVAGLNRILQHIQ